MYQKQAYHSGHRGQTRKPYGNRRPQNKSRQPKKDYIHPSRFVQSAKPSTDEPYVSAHRFEDFNLNSLIMRNILNMGFKDPSPIQDQTIAHGLNGKNIIGIADTGTGKTAAFAIPVLQRLIDEPKTKAIILAPTRELAEQIERQCRTIGRGSGLAGALLIGGTSMGPQLNDLRYNPRIIIGTPGRIKDHLERGSLVLSDCNLVVLDEVDRMLDMGFVHDITHILSRVNPVRQSFYFSATLDTRVKGIIENFSKNLVHISIKSNGASDSVNQDIVNFAGSENKIDRLHDILTQDNTTKTIVFDDTHRSVEKLSKELSARGLLADSIHGGKSQSQRQRVLKRFKNSEINVLVATDVAARGLDVSDITHVINYSLPRTYDDYVHRIGRTGRAGKIGQALTFVGQ